MPRRKTIVTRIEDDGDFIEAQFVRANGEVVNGKLLAGEKHHKPWSTISLRDRVTLLRQLF